MLEEGRVFIGGSRNADGSAGDPQYLTLKYGNRHGLITGATGTGKTVTLQILAEGFSRAGVPVFAADVKGDLAGIAAPGEPRDVLQKRAAEIGLAAEYRLQASPTLFWDLFGQSGHPIRATISEMGPLLLSRLMDLNPTQEGVLNIGFKLADDEGLLLLDLKDLQALLMHLSENAQAISSRYGNVAKASVGAIQRQLLVLEQQGGAGFFGEPALNIADLMRTTTDGRGIVSILAADRLMQAPRLYSTFLLWLLSELFENLPEVGDPEKPRLVFFFDEAHLLFDEAPKALVDKVEQVAKLIRSKGVGVYFVTQNPLDVPESVLAQLGNRVQHALRAYTPREQKAVRTAADTFRANPAFDVSEAITTLAVGEALVSTLGEGGVPGIVERTLVRPPSSRLGPITEVERRAIVAASPVAGLYDEPIDRQSAHEALAARAERPQEAPAGKPGKAQVSQSGWAWPDFGGAGDQPRRRTPQRQTIAEAAVKSVVRSVGSSIGGSIGRALVRGILGSLRK